MLTLASLRASFASPGEVTWIGVRPARDEAVVECNRVIVSAEGLGGDRYAGRDGKRAVTLLQTEHLPVIAALAGLPAVFPGQLRRNILVSGANLNALKDKPIRIGSAVLSITGPCAPCSKMERTLGRGGYNAMRGHGGWCARVLQPGEIALGDTVTATE